jgi:hopanoid biosynthesis associated RND transporter like protein HpnN
MAHDPVQDLESRPERGVEKALLAWLNVVSRRPRAVLAAMLLITGVLGGYAVTTLGVDTHHTAIISGDLPFWVYYNEFAEVFPILDEALLVVVDGETPARARRATARLAERLASRPELFSSVYVPGGHPFFEREALLYLSTADLEGLTNDLAGVQPLLAELSRDPSLRNLARVLQDGIEMSREHPELEINLQTAFDSLSAAADAVLEGRPWASSWVEVALHRKIPGESSRRVVVLEPVFDYDHILPGRAAMQAVRDAAAELELTPERGITVRVTGNAALSTEEMVLIARQVLAMGALSFLGIGLLLTFALRSRRLVLAILTTLLVGLIWTMAFAAFAVEDLNVVSIAFAILFIGLGVDFGIHLGMRYAALVRQGQVHASALTEAAPSVGGSLVLCSGTTMLGFYVFVPTDYRAVAELGLIAGTGMPISLFCTLTVLPALLSIGDWRSVGVEWRGSRWLVATLVHLATERARAVRIGAAVVGVAGACLVPFARFDHNVVSMRDPSTESVQTFNALLAESETSPWTIDVMETDLASAQAVAARLRELDVVERAVTLADYVPEEQEEKLAILEDMVLFLPEVSREQIATAPDAADQIAALRALRGALRAYRLVEPDDEARRNSALRAEARLSRLLERLETLEQSEEAAALASFERSLTGELNADLDRLWSAVSPELIGLEDLPPDLAIRMVAADGRARVEVLPSQDLADFEAHARFVDEVREVVPHATGSAVSLLEWGRVVSRAFREALALAFVGIALLLWLLWRRPGDVALVLIPLLFAAICTTATAILLDMPFNFGNVLVLPLLLGIGVDSGIHLVHRHHVALGEHPDRAPDERDLLGTSTAQAVFFSALTTVGGFGTLALVTHPGIRSLGQLLLVGMVFTVIANLVVLPAMLERRSMRRSPPSQTPVTLRE